MSTIIADKIIKNGKVYTVDKEYKIATAVAIKSKEIIFVGSDEEVKSYEGENTEIIDAKEGAVFPGFIDSHMHPAMSTMPLLYEMSFTGQLTKEEHLNTVRNFVKENPNLEVYSGQGFYPGAYSKEGPRKELLDEICSDKPILIVSDSGHNMWVNSKALEMCNMTKDTISPEGSTIEKDKITGDPTGYINGCPAIDLFRDIMPKYTVDQYKKAILYYQEWFNKEGLTTIYEAALHYYFEKNIIEAYRQLAEEGKLTIRIRGGWYITPGIGTDEDIEKYIEETLEYSKKLNTPYFQMYCYKFLLDGIVEENTAYMIEPYNNRDDGFCGECEWKLNQMKRFFKKIDKAKFQIHCHQIGDASARDALDALEYVYQENGRRDARHTFCHVQCIKDEDIDRMAALDVHASMAPYWLCADADFYQDYYIKNLGKYRASNMWRMKSLKDRGINVSTNCDFYVTEPNISEMLYSGVTRIYSQNITEGYYGDKYKRTLNNEPPTRNTVAVLPPYDERLELKDLVTMATINGARTNFMENEVGSIEVGKYADIVIYERDILNIDLEELPNEKPVMTIFDGNIVFNKEMEDKEEDVREKVTN